MFPNALQKGSRFQVGGLGVKRCPNVVAFADRKPTPRPPNPPNHPSAPTPTTPPRVMSSCRVASSSSCPCVLVSCPRVVSSCRVMSYRVFVFLSRPCVASSCRVLVSCLRVLSSCPVFVSCLRVVSCPCAMSSCPVFASGPCRVRVWILSGFSQILDRQRNEPNSIVRFSLSSHLSSMPITVNISSCCQWVFPNSEAGTGAGFGAGSGAATRAGSGAGSGAGSTGQEHLKSTHNGLGWPFPHAQWLGLAVYKCNSDAC